MATARKPAKSHTKAAVENAHSPWRALEDVLGYHFANAALLELALTHRSFAYEMRHGVADPNLDGLELAKLHDQRNQPGTDNEQLEFVGDAVLGLVITEALFAEFPQCTEGELTRMRSNLVSRKRLAEMSQALGLGHHLRLARSAEQNGGRGKPGALGNAAEAVMAAMYLDARTAGGDGLQPVRALARRWLLEPELPALRAALASETGRGILRDYKTLLQERTQSENAGKLRYVDAGQTGPAHQLRFSVEAHLENAEGTRVLATGEGSSKKEAQQSAAQAALANWQTAPSRVSV